LGECSEENVDQNKYYSEDFVRQDKFVSNDSVGSWYVEGVSGNHELSFETGSWYQGTEENYVENNPWYSGDGWEAESWYTDVEEDPLEENGAAASLGAEDQYSMCETGDE
jgi:hypothetical protein